MIEHISISVFLTYLVTIAVTALLVGIAYYFLLLPALVDESMNLRLRSFANKASRILVPALFIVSLIVLTGLPISRVAAVSMEQQSIFEEKFGVETSSFSDWSPVVMSSKEVEFPMTIILPNGEEYKTVLKSVPSRNGEMVSIYIVDSSLVSKSIQLFTIDNLKSIAEKSSDHGDTVDSFLLEELN